MGWAPSTLEAIKTSANLIPGISSQPITGQGLGYATSVEETIWDGGGSGSIGDWVPPTATRIHDIVSDDANDTIAGSGARVVLVSGISGGLITTELISMNGVTPVPTVNSYTMIHQIAVVVFGTVTGGVNAGEIRATAQTDSTVTCLMTAGNNLSFSSMFQIQPQRFDEDGI